MRAFDVFWIEMYFLALLTIVDASASQMCTFSNLSTNGQVVKAKIFRSLSFFGAVVVVQPMLDMWRVRKYSDLTFS